MKKFLLLIVVVLTLLNNKHVNCEQKLDKIDEQEEGIEQIKDENEQNMNNQNLSVYDRKFAPFLEDDCIADCIDDNDDIEGNASPPKTQQDYDDKIQPYVTCFEKFVGEDIAYQFNSPNIKVNKANKSKIVEGYQECQKKLDSKYYQVFEACKLKCTVDYSNSTSENISTIIFFIGSFGFLGFIYYKKKHA